MTDPGVQSALLAKLDYVPILIFKIFYLCDAAMIKVIILFSKPTTDIVCMVAYFSTSIPT